MQDASALRVRLPQALVRLGVRWPRATLAVWLLVCAAAVPGLARLEIDTSTDSVLDRGDPAWQVYQSSQELFGGDEIIVVAFRGEQPFDPAALDAVEAFGERAAELDGIRRIDSVATMPVIRVDDAGDLDLRTALEDAPTEPAARAAHVRERLAHDRIAPRSLVSADGRTFAVNLVLEQGAESRHAALLDELHAIVDPMGGVLSGVPVFRVAANARTQSEILAFAPLTGLVLAVFLGFLFRTARAIAFGVAPGALGSWLLVAAMGALGSPLGITTLVLPSIVLALGCAYAMHLLSAASRLGERAQQTARDDSPAHAHEEAPTDTPARAHEEAPIDALERALRPLALPIALSGLTTVIGFVSITVVRIEAVRATGGFGALGTLVATLASLTLLPACLALWPLPEAAPRGFDALRRRAAPALARAFAGRERAITFAWLSISLLVGLGALRLEVETDATRWLPRGHPVRDSYEAIREALSGISPLNVVVRVEGERSVLDPPVLAAIDGLARHLESLDAVGKTLSIADPLAQLHDVLGRAAEGPLPATRDDAEQYLLLLESVEAIGDLVTHDRRAANVLIRADDNASSELSKVADEAARWWSREAAKLGDAVTTGIMYEFARAEDEIAFGQLNGLAFGLAVISALLFAIFRWPRLAAVTLVPNALPLLLVFGCLGLLGLPLDAGTVLIGSLALGIAVDDTIHVATGFAEHARAGAAPLDALERTFADVLPAVVSTTLVVGSAFFVFGFSEFTITRNLGLVTGVIMVVCLLADLTLMPALLLRMPPRADAATKSGTTAGR